jgi:serine/threonine protein kinase
MSKLLGGRYKLGAMIGTGGMADVYVANDERLSRKVAVKVLRSDLARDPSFVPKGGICGSWPKSPWDSCGL